MPINLTAVARGLRKNSTDAERLLWRHLKAKQLDGLKFRQQEQIGRFIADFVCYENDSLLRLTVVSMRRKRKRMKSGHSG